MNDMHHTPLRTGLVAATALALAAALAGPAVAAAPAKGDDHRATHAAMDAAVQGGALIEAEFCGK
ncbi:hypothetical protein ACFYPC_07075 [Streptomyces sp. NPDC005808]|uniref:hypothetical protein n=1 Tax=Streptomyces sp. NPDC005808 TaxID=3364734 RepID=UPI00368579C7